MAHLRLTVEQQDIVYCESPLIYVSARAGTGKTTTLGAFVRARKADSFLYIVYNNTIKEEALGKFPESTTITTIHALAYKVFGAQFQEKLCSDLKIEDIFKLDYFKDKSLEDKREVVIANNVIKLINEYCNSNKNKIEDICDIPLLNELANEYWLKMIDPKSETETTHDSYLKLYQLSKPTLSYTYILVDEAQDSNEVMLDIINIQTCKKVFVGDPHQKIYGFRGAISVFEREEGHHLYLTESFRFGNEIAFIANKILSELKNEKNLISGSDYRDSVICEIDKEVQYTIITRTNARLIDIAIENAINGKKIYINGGDGMFKGMLEAYYLYSGKLDKITSNTLKTMKNYAHFKESSKVTKSQEALLQIYLIDKYGHSLLKWIELLKANMAGKKSADILLTTAHKSKGLEFVSVLIADDFNKIDRDISEEEINLIYVAITRATHDLELNSDLKEFMKN